MNKNLPIVIIGFVAVVAIVAGIILFQQNSKPPININGGNNNRGIPTTAPPGASPPWAKGASNALVTLEEFADFECPACGAFEPTLKEIKTAYGDRVRIIFRHYPLIQIHERAQDAALAAEAAGQQGRFWEMHDLLYEKQKDWTNKTADHRKLFADYAKTLGLDIEKFNADLSGGTGKPRIAADKQRGDYVSIRSTPSVFLNGRPILSEGMSPTRLRQSIDNALQGK